MHLLDTSVWIHYLRRPGDESVHELVAGLLDSNRAATCPIIILELLRGASSPKMFRYLKESLGVLPLFDVSRHVWSRSCELGFNLRMKGISIPTTDLIIAAVAIHEDIPIVSRDRHFELIASHSSLKSQYV